jgi:sec-independent protein translocase protein TatB
MFNVGGGEMIVILLLAMLVLGPDKLPSTAKKVGRFLHEFRRMTSGFEQEVRKAMDLENIDGRTSSSGTQNSTDAIHRSTSGPQLTGPTQSTISRNPPGERPAPFIADLSADSQADDRSL